MAASIQMQQTLNYFVKKGFRVQSQSDTQAQLLKPKNKSCLLVGLLFLFGILPGIIYLMLATDKSILLTDSGDKIQASSDRYKTRYATYEQISQGKYSILYKPGINPILAAIIATIIVFLLFRSIFINNGSTKIQNTPTVEAGAARSNPIPAGTEIIADDMAFVILGVERSADATVAAGNMFNSTPTADQEYIIVNLQVTCKKSSDEECSFTPDFSTEVIGDKGVSYSKEFVAGVPNEFQSSTFYGGATVSGSIPFLVGKGETGLLLIYDPIFGDKFYLALP